MIICMILKLEIKSALGMVGNMIWPIFVSQLMNNNFHNTLLLLDGIIKEYFSYYIYIPLVSQRSLL